MRMWFLSCVAGMAVTGAVASADVTALSPAVSAAIGQLSSEDYAQREKAVGELQRALGQELRALVEINDPEAQARMGEMLTFEEGLCAWAKDVLRLPKEKQKEAFDVGLRPEVLPYVALL